MSVSSARGAGARTAVAAGVMVALAAGCSGDERDFVEAVEVRELGLATLDVAAPRFSGEPPLTLSPGETVDLDLSARDSSDNELEIEVADRRWSVSDPSVGSVDGNGRFTAAPNASGSTDVNLVIGGVSAAPLSVVVSDANLGSIEVMGPESPERCVGSEYYAIGSFDDASERLLRDASFSVPDGARVRDAEDDAEGVAELVPTEAGPLVLTVESRGLTETRDLDVADTLQSIEISGPSSGFAEGDEERLTVTGTFTTGDTASGTRALDITDTVDFDLPETQFGSISNRDDGTRGTFTALEEGNVTVNARCGDVEAAAFPIVIGARASGSGSSGGLEFSVGNDVTLSLSFPLGQTVTVTDGDSDVTGTVTYTVRPSNIVDVVEDSTGMLTNPGGLPTIPSSTNTVTLVPLQEGRATVTARDDDDNFADLEVTVTQ